MNMIGKDENVVICFSSYVKGRRSAQSIEHLIGKQWWECFEYVFFSQWSKQNGENKKQNKTKKNSIRKGKAMLIYGRKHEIVSRNKKWLWPAMDHTTWQSRLGGDAKPEVVQNPTEDKAC